MGWANKLLGFTSNNGAEVDAGNQLKAVTTAVGNYASSVRLFDTDGGELLGIGQRMDTAQDTLLFEDFIDGGAIDARKWLQYATTQTIAQANGYMNLNSAAGLAINTGIAIQSVPYFNQIGEGFIYPKIDYEMSQSSLTNATTNIGLGTLASASSQAALLDFVGARYRPTGDFVISNWFNGVAVTETQIAWAGLIATYPGAGSFMDNVGGFAVPKPNLVHQFEVTVNKNEATIEMDHMDLGVLAVPAGYPSITSSANLPILIQHVIGATAPAAGTIVKVCGAVVAQKVWNTYTDWNETLCNMGQGAQRNAVTPFAQSANHANSTSPSSATLSNTAAGYSTLGGRWQFAAPAGAATDFALFAYLVPAGKRLKVFSVGISSVNTGAAVATTATILDWSVGVNASAVSLATTDSFASNAFAPARIALGVQGFIIGAGIGQGVFDIVRDFTRAPLVVDSGRYFHVIVQVPVGTATASQVIRGDFAINGVLE